QKVARHRVARYAPQRWERRAACIENRAPRSHVENQGVAVSDEYLVHILAVGRARQRDVGEHFIECAYRELLVAVHVAIRALVPAAANRRLQDVGVGFARRSVDLAFVAHARYLRPLQRSIWSARSRQCTACTSMTLPLESVTSCSSGCTKPVTEGRLSRSMRSMTSWCSVGSTLMPYCSTSALPALKSPSALMRMISASSLPQPARNFSAESTT